MPEERFDLGSVCPDMEILESFAAGTLDASKTPGIEIHASACRTCSTMIDDMRANLEFAVDLDGVAFRSDAETARLPDVPGCRIERLVGRGAQGAVYRALHLATGRVVAVKLLHGSGTTATRRFSREILLAARLRHPAIVDVFDGGVTSGSEAYIVMEWIDGRRLDDVEPSQRMTPRHAAAFMRACAEGVAHAHLRGVLHRDIKPANILVDDKGQARIVDFGVSRAIGDVEETALTATGQFVGTILYAAPEQFSKDADRIDARTDIYALGATLYQLLTGEPPLIVAGNVQATVKAIIEDEPKRPSSVDPGVPADLDAICLRALAKRPEHRYQTAGELADDLGAFLEGRPIKARSGERLHRLERLARRHRLMLVAALLVIGALAVAVAISISAEKKTRGALGRAEEEATRAKEFSSVLRLALGAPSPRFGGRDATLRSFLDEWSRLLERAEFRFAESEISLRVALARTYIDYDLGQDAERQVRRALDRVAAAPHVDPEDLLIARCVLFGILVRSDRNVEARELLAEIRRTSIRESSNVKLLGATYLDEAMLEMNDDRFDEALAATKRLEATIKADDPDAPRIRMRVDLARYFIHSRAKRPTETLELARTLAERFEVDAPREPLVARAMAEVAERLSTAGDHDRAMSLAARAVQMGRDLLLPDQPARQEALTLCCRVAARAKRTTEAVEWTKDLVEHYRRKPFAHLVDVAFASQYLGKHYFEAMRWEEAATTLEFAAAIGDRMPDGSPATDLDMRRMQAVAIDNLGRTEDAAMILVKGIEIASSKLSADAALIVMCRLLSVQYFERVDRFADARAQLEALLRLDSSHYVRYGYTRKKLLVSLERFFEEDDLDDEAERVRRLIEEAGDE